MTESDKVQEFLADSVNASKIDILDVEEGFHNRNFIVDTDVGKLVVRKQIGNPLGTGGLENERTVLEFMEHQDLDFMPESVFYSEEEDIHVIEFLDGEETSLEEMDNLNWVERLHDAHSLDFEDYLEFCDENNYEVVDVSSPEDRLKDLESESEELEDSELSNWLRDEIERFKNTLEFKSDPKPGLIHGDLPSSAIKSEDRIYFFDWEFADFRERPESDLADLFVSKSFSEDEEQEIIEKYRKMSNRGKGLKNDVHQLKRIKLLMQITWGLKQDDQLDFCKKQKKKYQNLV